MKNLRQRAILLLTLLLGLLLTFTPAAAQDWTIGEMGDHLRNAQTAWEEADADYDALCDTVFALTEIYENDTEAEQLEVQDKLLDAMIGEEDAYNLLETRAVELEDAFSEHALLLEESADLLTEHILTAQGYDSDLTITVLLDAENVIWNVDVVVEGDQRDQQVSEDHFLVQFIGRQLPLSTDKKDEDCITLLSDARVTSQAVVDALNSLEKAGNAAIPENPDKPLIAPQDIADYLFLYGKLPPNFITKKQAQNLGWDSSRNDVSDVAPGKSIGGDRFGNYEGRLPDKKGRTWYEADCYYTRGNRNAHRILFSSDGLVYYTDDHYETFTQMFPSWE